MSNNTQNTPLGNVDRDLVEEFKKLAGLVERDGIWSFLSEEVSGWKIKHNAYGTNKSGSDKYERGEIRIPIRSYNMEYAICKTKTIKEAMDFVKAKLIKNGKPVYLPDLLAERMEIQEPGCYTYGKILREAAREAKEK